MTNKEIKFSDLNGKMIVSIEGLTVGSDNVTLELSDGKKYRMFHSQDCCESVTIDEIHGDITDLIYQPILLAEEIKNAPAAQKGEYEESFTWTFYKIATIIGSVTIKWYGSSNGYYSESVSFEEIKQ